MADTRNRSRLRLLRFTPKQGQDLGQQLSAALRVLRQGGAPRVADSIEQTLAPVLVGLFRGLADQIDAESGGAR